MVDLSRFALFVSAATLLALTPGPGILYVLGRTLHGGRRDGVLSAFGTLVGGSVHVLAAAFGLSAVLATSATAFEVVRYAGAAYLIYLGISMIRGRRPESMLPAGQNEGHRHVLEGITTETLNPKTALFFLSFIPQFVSSARGHMTAQFLVLGAISVTLNTAVDLLAVVFADSLARRIKHDPQFGKKQRLVSGAGMIGLGVYVATTK